MIVVDTNIIAYLLIAGHKTELAQAAYRRDNDWLVPTLWRHEFLNVVATFVRHGGGEEADGRRIWQASLNLLGQREAEVDYDQALSLAVRHDISAYDAQFVVLAKARQLPLITEDRRLLRTFPDRVRSLGDFVERG